MYACVVKFRFVFWVPWVCTNMEQEGDAICLLSYPTKVTTHWPIARARKECLDVRLIRDLIMECYGSIPTVRKELGSSRDDHQTRTTFSPWKYMWTTLEVSGKYGKYYFYQFKTPLAGSSGASSTEVVPERFLDHSVGLF